jgi:hypothetical protein
MGHPFIASKQATSFAKTTQDLKYVQANNSEPIPQINNCAS